MYQEHQNIEKWIKQNNFEPTPTQMKLINWISGYKPTHFLTIQLPLNWRNGNIYKYDCKLKKILKRFQKCLKKNHWNKNPLPMICIAEKNQWSGYHYHILIYDCEYTTEQLQSALDRTEKDLRLTHQTFELEPITFTPEHLYSYCVKQIKTEHDIKERISTTSTIFNVLTKKPKKPAKKTKLISNMFQHIKQFVLKRLFIGCLWYRLTALPIKFRTVNYQHDSTYNNIMIT